MKKIFLIKDIMTTGAITVLPETSLLQASEIMVNNKFNGLPVVDEYRKVVGVVTQYDLLTKGTSIHLPTFMRIFIEYAAEERGERLIKEDLSSILSFTVKDVMNASPLTIPEELEVEAAVNLFSKHHSVNPIIVVNKSGFLAGIVSRYDIIKFYAKILGELGK